MRLDAAGEETRLLLIDDGNNRPNCTQSVPGTAERTCYSRAVEYDLDFTTGIASVRWQFEFPFQAMSSGSSASASSSASGGAANASDGAAAPKGMFNDSWVVSHDLYALDGGDALPLDENRTLVAFTGTWPGSDDAFENVSLVFELDESILESDGGGTAGGGVAADDGASAADLVAAVASSGGESESGGVARNGGLGGGVRGQMTIPRPSWLSGSYRVLPFNSVGGESQTSPLGAGADAPRVPTPPGADDDAADAAAAARRRSR